MTPEEILKARLAKFDAEWDADIANLKRDNRRMLWAIAIIVALTIVAPLFFRHAP